MYYNFKDRKVGSVDKTEATPETSELVTGLFLHQVEAHGDQREPAHKVQAAPVSYTHLTLPTILRV